MPNHETLANKLSLLDASLVSLTDLGCLVYSKELTLYIRARWAGIYDSLIPARIEQSMLTCLSNFKKRGLLAEQATLCPALTAERGEAIFTLIARSDWSLESRLVAAKTSGLRQFILTTRICDLLLEERDRFKDPASLLKLASLLARGLPGITVKYEQYELKAWRDVARGLIRTQFTEDERIRVSSALRLLTVPHFDQIYGAREDI